MEMDEKRFEIQNFGRTLVFLNPSEEDSGTYICEAMNGVGESKNNSMQVKYIQKSSLIII